MSAAACRDKKYTDPERSGRVRTALAECEGMATGAVPAEIAPARKGADMADIADIPELDVLPPLENLKITLELSPTDVELAVATKGDSLPPATMRALVAALVVGGPR
jgi:hypothetical protein